MSQASNLIRIVVLCCLIPIVSAAREPEPSFPETIELETGSILSKTGEYRYVYRVFFKLYDAALYAAPEVEIEKILAAETSFRLQFRYLREIEKSIILESSAKMLEKNLSPDELAQIADRVDRINQAYKTVRDGDRSSLTFIPGRGTSLRINGKSVTTIEGEDFAKLYFKIWLGEQPISLPLRESLLGR